jgi:hypothetical protein
MDLSTARRMSRQVPNLVNDQDYFSFEGGLNIVDTPLRVRPGQLLACKNYEPFTRGGYERVSGFERFDGRLKPSEATYYILKFDAGIPAQYPVVGNTVTGMTSAATGVVLVTPVQSGGSGELVLGRVTGTFQDNEGLDGPGTQFGTADGVATVGNAATDEDDAIYTAAAVADARAQILVVPGSGPIRGVVTYKGVSYAFRNNAGATAVVMHKSSSSGWVACALGSLLRFDAGLTSFAEGETVTGGTSGATATVRRVVVRSGDWGTDDAAGYLILTGITGTFQNNEALTTTSGSAIADGTVVANTLPVGGSYKFRIHNFYGHAATRRLYATNGVGKAFEYQDSPEFMCPLETGMSSDAPINLAVHKSQLWLAFTGGSVQKSGAGTPVAWTVITGAAELAVGDEITEFLEEVGGTLFVFSQNSAKYIAGNEADGYVMDNFGFETGARANSMQRIGNGVFLDDRGFTTLAASDKFGNFAANSVSEEIAPLVEELRPLLTASVTSKTLNRVRYFFSDTRFLTIGFTGNKITGFGACDYGKVVRCTDSGEGPDGAERILFGSDDGFVYEADRGTSFDGGSIQAFLRPVFHHSKTPSRIKRYRLAQIDVDTQGPTTLKATVDYSYADPTASGESIKDVTLRGGGGFWNVDKWNEFIWSAGVVAIAKLKLEGSGYNIGLLFSHDSATEKPHRLSGVTFHISQRRLNRSTA